MPLTREQQATTDELALRFIELLSDEQVLAKLKRVLYPRDLADKIESLTTEVSHLRQQLTTRDEYIVELEKRVSTLETDLDSQGQYTRRANLLIQNIAENDDGEDTDKIVLDVINGKMGLTPALDDIALERSHRLGSRVDQYGNKRTRAIIVRFKSERVRDTVFRARGSLKTHNDTHEDNEKIWLNEDLTDTRAYLLYKARQLRKAKKISDCWSTYGKIMVKDLANSIKNIKAESDLDVY